MKGLKYIIPKCFDAIVLAFCTGVILTAVAIVAGIAMIEPVPPPLIWSTP